MLTRLLKYVMSLAPDKLDAVGIEEMAVCLAWFNSLEDQSGQTQPFAALPSLIERWCARPAPQDPVTEGRRQQPLLRRAIATLLEEGFPALSREQLTFLSAAHALVQQAKHPECFARIEALLSPHLPLATTARAPAGSGLDVARLFGKLVYVDSAEIRKAATREVRVIAGIEEVHRGPVFTHQGDLKVLDSIPEDCLVVVDGGSCTVNGYVLGRLAATKHCEIRENISDLVVTRCGDVRVRKIIDRACVVAKQGDVYCKSAYGADLVFAGRKLHVAEDAIGGRYIAPHIEVEGALDGGEVHVTNRARAARFSGTPARPLSIVLRDELSCRDYGESPGPDVGRLTSAAARLRQRIQMLREMQDGANQEIEDLANNAVLYICVGDSVKHRMNEIQKIQRRLAFLNRVTTGLYSFSAAVGEHLRVLERRKTHPENEEIQLEELSSVFDAIEAALAPSANEDYIERDVQEELERLAVLHRSLMARGTNRRHVWVSLTRLRERLDNWLNERRQLTAELDHRIKELSNVYGRIEVLEQLNQANTPRLEVLRTLLAADQEQERLVPLVQRAKHAFPQLMLKSIRSRGERIKKLRASEEQARKELETIRERLAEYQIVGPEEGDGAEPCAVGCFDAGVRLYRAPYFLAQNKPAPEAALLTPSGAADTPTRYVRRASGSIEREDA